ncbi:hypothetical protein HKD37_11G031783 [Glycine soja]
MARGRGRPKKKVPSLMLANVLKQSGRTNDSERSPTIEHEVESNATVEEEKIPTLDVIEDDPVVNQKIVEEPKKLWVDVISGNRIPSNGAAIEYFAPKVVEGEIEVEIEEEDILSELKYWETTLIMYVLGRELSMNAVKQYMMKFWSFVQLPEMYYHEDGDMLRTLPVWVKLPNLPLYLWGTKSLGKIGSALGNPLFTDECTANKLRVSYARILVEIDVTQKQRENITIRDKEGNKITQPVEFEWKPKFYELCQKAGHQCKEKPNKQWREKPKSEVIVKNAKQKTVERARNNPGEPESSSWTNVKSSSRNKGKMEETIHEVRCQNGFDVFKIGGLEDILNTGT